ncbi:hypothetical protein B0H13DRAFT_1873642 [Mycena leptocephala]|nr:hypothetical protein B0H13DRAFT_1873642 [Mycena leptocephala]
MLLLLILVHLLTKNCSAVPVALPLAPRSSAGTCDDINNCRKLFDIVWGCLATIFACTWVSVHPNVPPPDQSRVALFWRRLKVMLIGIIAPEIMVSFAARQFYAAWVLSKEYNFSRTHGYFFGMGGFISSAGYPIATRKQLEDSDLGPEFLKAIRNVDSEDIMDKRIWFTMQCVARIHQHLAVTELEVATLAFAVVNLFTWLLWWDKPLDVQRPMVVGPPKSPDAQPIIPRGPPSGFLYGVFGVVIDNEHNYDPFCQPQYPHSGATVGVTALVGTVFGAIHCTAWNTDFPTTTEMWIWRSASLVITAVPVVLAQIIFLLTAMEETTFDETILGRKTLRILVIALVGGVPIYIIARLILLVLPLTALRCSPPPHSWTLIGAHTSRTFRTLPSYE